MNAWLYRTNASLFWWVYYNQENQVPEGASNGFGAQSGSGLVSYCITVSDTAPLTPARASSCSTFSTDITTVVIGPIHLCLLALMVTI